MVSGGSAFGPGGSRRFGPAGARDESSGRARRAFPLSRRRLPSGGEELRHRSGVESAGGGRRSAGDREPVFDGVGVPAPGRSRGGAAGAAKGGSRREKSVGGVRPRAARPIESRPRRLRRGHQMVEQRRSRSAQRVATR